MMGTNLDHVLDRRRLRRKLTIWRVATILTITVALISVFFSFSGFKALDKKNDHIALVPINGFISSSRYAIKRLEKIGKNKQVKAVIVAIDSPGGTTVGGEQLYHAIRAIAEKKPVVTSIGGLAASAGYMVAVASDHVIAPRTSIVGSVGVILQYPNASKLLQKIGVSVEEIKSSPLKAEPSPFNSTPPEATAMLQSMLLDTYSWFADLVKRRRGFSDDQAKGLLDGSVFTGKQALDRGLIDALGNEKNAKEWLVKQKNINADIEIVTWSLSKPPEDFLSSKALVSTLLGLFGLSYLVDTADRTLENVRISHFDGFLSVWQGGLHTIK